MGVHTVPGFRFNRDAAFPPWQPGKTRTRAYGRQRCQSNASDIRGVQINNQPQTTLLKGILLFHQD
jgi:hypothetical protein